MLAAFFTGGVFLAPGAVGYGFGNFAVPFVGATLAGTEVEAADDEGGTLAAAAAAVAAVTVAAVTVAAVAVLVIGLLDTVFLFLLCFESFVLFGGFPSSLRRVRPDGVGIIIRKSIGSLSVFCCW